MFLISLSEFPIWDQQNFFLSNVKENHNESNAPKQKRGAAQENEHINKLFVLFIAMKANTGQLKEMQWTHQDTTLIPI